MLCYTTIGLPLAVIPGFVRDTPGYDAVLAGLAVCRRSISPPSPPGRSAAGYSMLFLTAALSAWRHWRSPHACARPPPL